MHHHRHTYPGLPVTLEAYLRYIQNACRDPASNANIGKGWEAAELTNAYRAIRAPIEFRRAEEYIEQTHGNSWQVFALDSKYVQMICTV